ncbi:cytidine deaminase family protein [Enterococcus faecium]|uniref:cytidine deaminase family protein n=1 Tax=Enterococcus TaxID=1350 RepID=UPI0039080437
MSDLSTMDLELVDAATEVIKSNIDLVSFNHTVGAAVRCTNGNVYTGVNVYSNHGACAEIIALGTAISRGERDFECIVAVGGDHFDMIYSPCGNCRQFILEYAPACEIIVSTEEGLKKSKLRISFHMLTTDQNDFYTNRFSFYFQSTEGLMMLDE